MQLILIKPNVSASNGLYRFICNYFIVTSERFLQSLFERHFCSILFHYVLIVLFTAVNFLFFERVLQTAITFPWKDQPTLTKYINEGLTKVNQFKQVDDVINHIHIFINFLFMENFKICQSLR